MTIEAPPVKHKIVEKNEYEDYDGGRPEDIEVHKSQRRAKKRSDTSMEFQSQIEEEKKE